MKGRHKILERQGDPAPYVKATLRLDRWNGAGGITSGPVPSTREIARGVERWVRRVLEQWKADEP
jgi:hypothetical protein